MRDRRLGALVGLGLLTAAMALLGGAAAAQTGPAGPAFPIDFIPAARAEAAG